MNINNDLVMTIITGDMSFIAISLALVTFIPTILEYKSIHQEGLLKKIEIRMKLRKNLIRLCYISVIFLISLITGLILIFMPNIYIYYLSIGGFILGIIGVSYTSIQLGITLIELISDHNN